VRGGKPAPFPGFISPNAPCIDAATNDPLFVQAARAVLLRPQSWEKHGLKSWIEAAARRLNRFKLAIALANKIARIVWGVLHGGRNFELRTFRPALQAA
jgi:hypothetical protein